MSYRFSAILSEDGHVTIPSDVRERLKAKAGDLLDIQLSEPNEPAETFVGTKSIFDDLDQFRLPALGRPLSQRDIDDAIGAEMIAQEDRIRNQK